MGEKKLTDEVVVAKNTITDEEIVKALECCSGGITGETCKNCPLNLSNSGVDACYYDDTILEKYALDLINRQKSEIERLKIDLANEKNWGKIQTKQAVKDTAREIIAAVKDCMRGFEDDDDGYLLKKGEFEFFMREIAKLKGVEVE